MFYIALWFHPIVLDKETFKPYRVLLYAYAARPISEEQELIKLYFKATELRKCCAVHYFFLRPSLAKANKIVRFDIYITDSHYKMNPNEGNPGHIPWKCNLLEFEDNPELGSNLCWEEVRLRTFRNWPLNFMNPEDLARNGFYYLGRGDEVRCAFCKVEIMRWEKGDDPAEDHQRWAPQCPFLRNQATSGNVPVNPDVTVGDEEFLKKYDPAHPEYASQAVRLRTFVDWPRSMRQTPQELAGAGFFYTGHGDRTKCFYCGGGLMDWESHDEPWEQHARWFDRCPYVRLVKGRNYIQRVLSDNCPAEVNNTHTPKSKTKFPPSSKGLLSYFLYLLLSNTLSDIYLGLKQTIFSQGAGFGNRFLISLDSVTLRLMTLWSRSRSVTQDDWRGVSLAFQALVTSSVASGNQIVNKVLHWSVIKRILSLLRIFYLAFF